MTGDHSGKSDVFVSKYSQRGLGFILWQQRPHLATVFTGETHETHGQSIFVSADLEGMMTACMQPDPWTKARVC